MRTLAALLTLTLAPAVTAPVALAQDEQGVDEPCTIVGRVLDTAGRPVAGVGLRVSGWQANSTRVQRHGAPKDWVDPDPVQSDDEGRFEISFVPPRAYQFVLGAGKAGFGSIAWRWSEIRPGESVELGDTTLEPAAVLVGHIVDAQGDLLVEGWRVSARHNWNGVAARAPRSTSGALVDIDPDTGMFRIEDLPPGEIRLTASNRAGADIEVVNVVSKAGEETVVELVYEGPDPTRRIVLTITSRPFYTFAPDPGTVHAIDADGARIALTRVPGRASSWHATDLEPGVYTLEIDDDRFEPWRMEDVRTGVNQHARLIGSAALELNVIDTLNGNARVSEYGLRLDYMNANFSPSKFTVQDDLGLEPADHRFVGIVPGSWELEIRPQGAPPTLVEVLDLAPGETRKVDVRLGVFGAVSGRVLHPDGRPAAGVRVQITRGETPGHSGPEGAVTSGMNMVDGKQVLFRIEYRDDETLTAADGSFHFGELAAGTHAVRAILSPWTRADALVEVAENATARSELTIPVSGEARVRLALPAHIDPTAYFVGVHSLEGVQALESHSEEPAGAARLDADGACTLAGLPPGDANVYLAWRQDDGVSSMFPNYALGVAAIDGGAVVDLRYDLRESFPSNGELQITLAGERAPSLSVVFERSDAGEGEQREFHGAVFRGRGSITAVPPGRYRVQAEAFNVGWSWSFGDEVVVENGKPFVFAGDIPLVSRTLHVVDERGRDVRATQVGWEAEGARYGPATGQTDARGRITLEVPPGTYALRHGKAREGGVEFELAAGAGELEVRLPAPDDE